MLWCDVRTENNAAHSVDLKILDHSGIVWNCWMGALAHQRVARANALESRTSQGADADAAASGRLPYKDFLTLWKAADPDIPNLNQAKVLCLARRLTPATRVGE